MISQSELDRQSHAYTRDAAVVAAWIHRRIKACSGDEIDMQSLDALRNYLDGENIEHNDGMPLKHLASAVHLRRSALCSATSLPSLTARDARSAARHRGSDAVPHALAALSVTVHTGRRRPGQPLDHQLAASGIVRGLELEPPSLRPAPRPRADSRPVARSQVPDVSPPQPPLPAASLHSTPAWA